MQAQRGEHEPAEVGGDRLGARRHDAGGHEDEGEHGDRGAAGSEAVSRSWQQPSQEHTRRHRGDGELECRQAETPGIDGHERPDE